MRVFCLIAGIALTIWAVVAVVQAMLIPSGPGPLITRGISRIIRGAAFTPLVLIRTYSRQNKWLTGVAPVSLLIQLIVYLTILTFTLGLIVFGTTQLSFMDSLYQSGSTLTTLGIVEPVNTASTITTFFAAFLGLVIIAIFIGYLMAIYGALVARESGMARLSILAGEPAWGPQILARAHVLGLPADEAPRYVDWTNWTCDVRLNQRVNAVLGDFRSTAELRHWIVTMLAVMDATALRIAFDPDHVDPHAVQLLVECEVTLTVLEGSSRHAHDWASQDEIRRAIATTTTTPVDAGLSEDDWQMGINSLNLVDYPLPGDLEAARQRFFNIRHTYAAKAYSVARQLHAVPAPWSGTRNPQVDTIWPELARVRHGQ